MTFTKYPKMKDSGIEWIGKIPNNWKPIKLGHYTKIVRGGSPRPAGDPRFFDGDHTPWITVNEVTEPTGKYLISTKTSLTEDGVKQSRLISEGTLLFSNSGATLGVPKISKISGCINDGSIAFLNVSNNLSIHFLYYSLEIQTDRLREQQKGHGQPNLNTELVSVIQITLPTLTEQKQITSYLDEKTAEIDDEITKNQNLIKLLEEKKESEINRAVTKGLDDTVPMKDSGIEWIGEIPEEWEILQFKRFSTLRQGLQIPISERFKIPGKNRFEYITIKSIHQKKSSTIKEYVENPSSRVICNSENVLMARTGNTGEVVTGVSGVFHNNFFLIDFNEKMIQKEYLVYSLKISSLKELILLFAGVTTIPDLNHGDFLSLSLCIPSKTEQKQIVSYLDKKTAKIDSLISKIQLQISNLQEFRESLISSVVTGKICVTN